MAMDEVLEHQSQMRFRANFPSLINLALSIDTNADDVAGFSRGVVIDWSCKLPPEWLACCANPDCRGIQQLDLVEVGHNSEGGHIIRPSLKERLFGPSVVRRAIDIRLGCRGFTGDRYATNTQRCTNMFHVTGIATYTD